VIFKLLLVAIAAVFLAVPHWLTRRSSERLAELRNGAPEQYFEERRALETYRSSKQPWRYRLIGLVAMAFAIGSLVFHH